jgi:hypothetical protein
MHSFTKKLCQAGVGAALVLGLGACGGQELAETEAGSGELASVESALTVYQDLGSSTGNRVMNTITCGAPNQVKPICVTNSTASERLYSWTAPYSGTFRISTFGSGFDTVLQIYDTWGNPLQWCNDNANGTLQSEVRPTLSAGQKIIISVDGYGSTCGYFEININPG